MKWSPGKCIICNEAFTTPVTLTGTPDSSCGDSPEQFKKFFMAAPKDEECPQCLKSWKLMMPMSLQIMSVGWNLVENKFGTPMLDFENSEFKRWRSNSGVNEGMVQDACKTDYTGDKAICNPRKWGPVRLVENEDGIIVEGTYKDNVAHGFVRRVESDLVRFTLYDEGKPLAILRWTMDDFVKA